MPAKYRLNLCLPRPSPPPPVTLQRSKTCLSRERRILYYRRQHAKNWAVDTRQSTSYRGYAPSGPREQIAIRLQSSCSACDRFFYTQYSSSAWEMRGPSRYNDDLCWTCSIRRQAEMPYSLTLLCTVANIGCGLQRDGDDYSTYCSITATIIAFASLPPRVVGTPETSLRPGTVSGSRSTVDACREHANPDRTPPSPPPPQPPTLHPPLATSGTRGVIRLQRPTDEKSLVRLPSHQR